MSSVMTSGLKELHDKLLAEKPAGAVHDSETCSLCAMEDHQPSGEGDMTTTYTEDQLRAEVDQAVKAATAERDAKITELTSAAKNSETETAVKEAVAAKESEIAELRQELDKKELEAGNAVSERDAIVAWLEGEKSATEQREAAAARKDSRLAKLKEVAAFREDYLTQNADRFAAMSDEEFDARCQEYAALGGKPAGSSEIPSGVTGLKAGQEGPGSNGRSSAVKDLLAYRRDPRGHVDLSSLSSL